MYSESYEQVLALVKPRLQRGEETSLECCYLHLWSKQRAVRVYLGLREYENEYSEPCLHSSPVVEADSFDRLSRS